MKDDIIEMARKCGLMMRDAPMHGVLAFAEMVREAEREACAKVCDEYANGLERNYSELIADAIRARGQA